MCETGSCYLILNLAALWNVRCYADKCALVETGIYRLQKISYWEIQKELLQRGKSAVLLKSEVYILISENSLRLKVKFNCKL